MSLADRLDDTTPDAVPHAGCGVGRLLDTLDETDRQAVDEALERLPTSAVARHVNDELGTRLASNTWSRHLRGDCACDKVGLA